MAPRQPAAVRAQHRHRRRGPRRAVPEIRRPAGGDGRDRSDRQRVHEGDLFQAALRPGAVDAAGVPPGHGAGGARDEVVGLRARAAAHRGRRAAPGRRGVARGILRGGGRPRLRLRAAPRVLDDAQARTGVAVDPRRHPRAFPLDRLGLRAVAAAPADPLAAGARRSQPCGLLRRRRHHRQRLRARPRAHARRRRRPPERSRTARGGADAGRVDGQRLRDLLVPAGDAEAERRGGTGARAVLQGGLHARLRLRARPRVESRRRQCERQPGDAEGGAGRRPRDERLRAVAAAPDGGPYARRHRRSARRLPRRRGSPLAVTSRAR